MSILQKLFSKGRNKAEQAISQPDQAVIVHLDGQGLPDRVYQECDLATLEDQLQRVIQQAGLGEFDGNEIGSTETTLFMYGPDAEKLFAGIQSTLRSYPLCQNARVVIRLGGPGAKQREVTVLVQSIPS